MGKIRDVCRKLETRVRGSNGGCGIGGIRVLQEFPMGILLADSGVGLDLSNAPGSCSVDLNYTKLYLANCTLR